ncbi:MAG: DUF721 domain-containing protein [Candidatus Binatia bacterium]|nr:DUF721 domain-containing protein [Candidatus Binatia bacterium]
MNKAEGASTCTPLAETLRGILRRLDAEQNLDVYRLFAQWEAVVGQQIARRVQPLELRNGVLLLLAASATWRQELEFLKPQLLDSINAHVGPGRVRDLVIVVGSPRSKANSDRPRVAAPSLPKSAVEPLANWEAEVARVRDPELANAFRRLVEARERLRSRLEAEPAKTRGGTRPRNARRHERRERGV